FPGKNDVLPAGCLYSPRVWLRANGVHHRLFGEDELWVGADPEFGMVENASFGCLWPGGATALGVPDAQVYDAVVGRARVQFVIRWVSVSFFSVHPHNTGAVSRTSNGRPAPPGLRRVAFLVYTVPVRSVPAGASHRLRACLKTRRDDPSAGALDDSYAYQRVRRSDAFKIGARLDFEALGPRIVMGSPARAPQTVVTE
ncbi:hypothetical protein B0H14DRAFT_2163631, partial [Mycena olivaceomarginata]